jgi:hypothetical protein
MTIEFKFSTAVKFTLWRRRVVTSRSLGGRLLLRSRFKPISMQVEFIADETAFIFVFSPIILPASISNHSTDAPCLFNHLLSTLCIHRNRNHPGIKRYLPNGELQWRTEGSLGVQTPLPKFRSFDKTEPNSLFRGKYIRNKLRTPD